MTTVFELLMLASLIGAIDVLYFHLYRFRLYARAESQLEELTHLIRHVLFLAITALVMSGPGRATNQALWALLAADLVNTTLDVLLERRSRSSLGGLPSAEYLLHVLGSLLVGAVVATHFHQAQNPVAAALTPTQSARGLFTLASGSALLVLEATLFARSLASRCCPAQKATPLGA
jgi:hypothetical protein